MGGGQRKNRRSRGLNAARTSSGGGALAITLKVLVFVIAMLALGDRAVAAQADQLAWSSLSPAQQRVLEPVEKEWDQLPVPRRRALARGSQRWLAMDRAERGATRERLQRWRGMDENRRDLVRERWNLIQSLAREERQRLRADLRAE